MGCHPERNREGFGLPPTASITAAPTHHHVRFCSIGIWIPFDTHNECGLCRGMGALPTSHQRHLVTNDEVCLANPRLRLRLEHCIWTTILWHAWFLRYRDRLQHWPVPRFSASSIWR